MPEGTVQSTAPMMLMLPLLAAGLSAAEDPVPALRCVVPDAQIVNACAGRRSGLQAIIPDGPKEPGWAAAAARASQTRIQLEILPYHGGSESWRVTVGMLAPEAADLPPGPGMRAQRAGAWWLTGHSPIPLDLPAIRPLSVLTPGTVLSLAASLGQWPRLLAAEPADAWNRLLAEWHLDRVELAVDMAASRLVDRTAFPGAQLPIRAVAPDALAGMPVDTLAVLAVGVDGAALAKSFRLLAGVAGLDADALEASAVQWSGLSLGRMIEALDGTWCLALHGDPAKPDILIGLPSHADLDQALERWMAIDQPDQAAGMFDAAREQAVALKLPGARPFFVRRGGGRLWLSTSARLLNACAAEPLQPFPVAEQWPSGTGACILAHWSAPAFSSLNLSVAAGGIVIRQDKTGVSSLGEEAFSLLVPVIAAAPSWLPPLAQHHAQECERISAESMRTILSCALSFAKQTSGHWPRDLDDLRAWARVLGPERFASAGRPDLRDPFCFVPPLVEPPADQPVLVQDPAANDGRGSLVGFANGQVEFRAGLLYWQEAQRLAQVARQRNVSIDISEWATTPKTF